MKMEFGRTGTGILKSALWLSLTAIAAVGFWACDPEESEAEPTLSLVTPANGSTIMGPNVLVKVKTTGFTYAGAVGKVSAAQHDVKGGHVHIFLDKPDELDANAITNLTKYDTATISITTAGKHYIIVAGADADHEDVESMRDSMMFTVTLP